MLFAGARKRPPGRARRHRRDVNTAVATCLLCLFDINGTLLPGDDAIHHQAMLAAAEAVWGVQLTVGAIAEMDIHGLTDQRIISNLLRRNSVAQRLIDERLDDWVGQTVSLYKLFADEDECRPAVDADATLTELEAAGHKLALLTGNLESIARIRIDRAGLSRFFPAGQGAFGSDHALRKYLVPIARERAGIFSVPWDRQRTVVVGDTPRDVGAAHEDLVPAIAVSTGAYDPEMLRGAEATVPSLLDAAEQLLAWTEGRRTGFENH